MWVFLVTEIMFFGGLFMAYLVYRSTHPDGFPGSQQSPQCRLGRGQHHRADRQLADDGARGPRRADQRAAEDAGGLAASRRWCSARRSSASRRSSTPTSSSTTSCRGRTSQWEGQYPQAGGAVLLAVLLHDGLHALHMVIGLGIMTVIAIMAWKRQFDCELLHAGRSRWPVLALRRHRLDLPVPAAVPDRLSLRRTERLTECLVTSHPKSMYLRGLRRPDRRHDPDRPGRRRRPRAAEQHRHADDRVHEGAAGHPLLHARPLEHAADLGRRRIGFFWLLILFSLTHGGLHEPRMGPGHFAVGVVRG